MPLSKEKMREYQKERRAKLKKDPSDIGVIKPGKLKVFGRYRAINPAKRDVPRETNPDLLNRIEALDKRVTMLENRATHLEVIKVVEQVTKKGKNELPSGDDAKGLYARVMAQKEARIRGTV
jgi:hypothetical protein